MPLIEKAYGRDSSQLSLATDRLAELYYYHGKFAEAEKLYKRDIAIAQGTHADDDPRVVTPLYKLADLKFVQGKYSEAKDIYEQALRVCDKTIGEDSARAMAISNKLVETYRKLGEEKKASAMEKRIAKISEPVKIKKEGV